MATFAHLKTTYDKLRGTCGPSVNTLFVPNPSGSGLECWRKPAAGPVQTTPGSREFREGARPEDQVGAVHELAVADAEHVARVRAVADVVASGRDAPQRAASLKRSSPQGTAVFLLTIPETSIESLDYLELVGP